MADRLSPRLLLDPAGFLALGFGSGLVPVGPGTAGTLVAVPLYLLLQDLHPGLYLGLVVLLFVVGIPICSRVAHRLGAHDHPAIVWDEIVGYLVTMTLAPAGWGWVMTGFILFRVFDIAKPWPIRWCDRHVSGGFGIMLDDLLAAVFAAVILQSLAYFL